jgi:hypothetical protein
MKGTAVTIAALILTPLVASAGFIDGAVIATGKTSLGVNPHGHLNYVPAGDAGGIPPLPIPPAGAFGVHYDGVGDAVSSGCLCEGWGVWADGAAAWASVDNGGIGNLGPAAYAFTSNSFLSTTFTANSDLRVDHWFAPSLAADIFQVAVTLTNTSDLRAIGDVRYIRVMDWDAPPLGSGEFITHDGVLTNLIGSGGNILAAHNDGFTFAGGFTGGAGNAPLDAETLNVDFGDFGPRDQGSFFELAFGPLRPGESRTFYLYYGAAPDEETALERLAFLEVDAYSLAQNSATDPIVGDPATFIAAFSGIGGIAPGISPANPLLPGVPGISPFGTPIFTFPVLPSMTGNWYDPPFVDTFEYEITGGFFSGVDWEAVFGTADILVWDGVAFSLAGSHSGADGISPFAFGAGVTKFRVAGLDAKADAGDPLGFATYLDFTASGPSTITMFGVGGEVPEPGTFLLLGAGLAVGIAAGGRMRRWF